MLRPALSTITFALLTSIAMVTATARAGDGAATNKLAIKGVKCNVHVGRIADPSSCHHAVFRKYPRYNKITTSPATARTTSSGLVMAPTYRTPRTPDAEWAIMIRKSGRCTVSSTARS